MDNNPWWTLSVGERVESTRIVSTYRLPGEAVQNLEFFVRAWDECIELQQQQRDTWVGKAILSLQGMARWELAAFCGVEFAGGLVLAHDPWDVHVGPCMSVFAQYVLPEHRLKGASPRLMREAIRIARKEGVTTFAYTHRAGAWRYSTLYRSLNEVPKN